MASRGRARAALLILAGALLPAGCGGAPASPAASPPPRPSNPAPSATPAVAVTPAPAAPPVTSAPATYTLAQADRGEAVFGAVCSVCHGLGEFRGQIFQITWMARPVGHFFQHISAAMPQDAPGTLTPEEYAAVTAHVLRLNGVSPGGLELPADPRALEAMRWSAQRR